MRGRLLLGLMLLLTGFLSGCSNTVGKDPDARPEIETPDKTYKGLAGQKCAIMVWAGWGTRLEYNQIQLDLARLLEPRLAALFSVDKDSKKERRSPAPSFLNPASVVRFQREHPEIDGQPITQVAPRFGREVTRVIYVEIEDFSAQSAQSIMLLKGMAKATLRVVEVSNGQAYVAFEEHGIEAHYPPNAPEGVVPTDKINARTIYEGTLTLLADKLAARFEGEQKD